MRVSLCTLATVLPAIHAIHLLPRDAALPPSVVNLDIERRSVANPVERDRLRRRQKVIEQTLDNEQTLYFCNLTLGTPDQKLRMHIDTGSSDLWVNYDDSSLCDTVGDPCETGGTYDPKDSSTYKFVSDDFNISYVDGSGASGDYVTDTLKIGGATLKDFQFGIGQQSTSKEGVLGIGYVLNEVQVGRNGKKPYPNLPQALVDAGLIRSNAYSLWLNDLSASKGSILFGGVNTAKFEGSLHTLPIIPVARNIYAELSIALTGVALEANGETQDLTTRTLPVAALLDSGSSLSYLPDPLVSQIYSAVDATYDPDLGAAYVPCKLGQEKASVIFTFSSPAISVGMDEMVIDLGPNPDGSRPEYTNGEPACVFGIAPAGRGTVILGDTFLRSAYVVYDLANNEISLAKTNFNSTSDEIVEIGTGKNSVPDATGVPGAVTSAQMTATQGGPLGGPTGSGGGLTLALSTSTGMAVPTARPEMGGFGVGMAGWAAAGAGVVFAAM
ncbi:hypothetical protein FQN51_001996 [Onygenales sp. PD_10]|nr:hypothetical protein FQN51_001996 [Onygenales sp. PD_10]